MKTFRPKVSRWTVERVAKVKKEPITGKKLKAAADLAIGINARSITATVATSLSL
jgi:hypothetical protein